MSARSERRQPERDEGSEEDGGRPLRGQRSGCRGAPARPELATEGALTGIDDVRAPLGSPPGGAVRFRRRDLLAWGGAAALLPAFSRPAHAQEELAASSEVLRPLSVGFVEGSELWRRYKGVTGGALNRGISNVPGKPPEAAPAAPAPPPAPPFPSSAPLGPSSALAFLLEITPAPNSPILRRPSLVTPA